MSSPSCPAPAVLADLLLTALLHCLVMAFKRCHTSKGKRKKKDKKIHIIKYKQ
jgi:hypothetical protein